MKLKTKKFKCWYNLTGEYDLEFFNHILMVRIEIPYSFKWIQIVDNNQNELYSKIYLSRECKCNLKALSSGIYYFNIYGSYNGFNYESYIGGKQIILELNNAREYFFLLPVYASWNIDLLKTHRLDYVLCNTLLDNQHTMMKRALKLTLNCKSIREKVMAIHDFVAQNLYYDFDSISSRENTNRSIAQIAQTKRCVCQGYADFTLVLLASIGIQAENILCYVVDNIFERGWSDVKNRTSELNHIITRVKLENRWLFMDVTWDSNNRYENGKYIKGADVSHRYFDVTLPFLSATHRFFKLEH